MSGTAPRPDQGACDERGCLLAFGHRGEHHIRRCTREGCENRTRNLEERYCTRHEDRATYERYGSLYASECVLCETDGHLHLWTCPNNPLRVSTNDGSRP